MSEKNKGWIMLHRSLQDNWLWSSERFSFQAAWVDLILMVNHEDKDVRIDSNVVTIHEGQKWTSIKQLSIRWKWSTKRTSNFLQMLESDGMIARQMTKRGTLITLLNYNKFNGSSAFRGKHSTQQKNNSGNTEETLKNHSLPINNNITTINNEKQLNKRGEERE